MSMKNRTDKHIEISQTNNTATTTRWNTMWDSKSYVPKNTFFHIFVFKIGKTICFVEMGSFDTRSCYAAQAGFKLTILTQLPKY
jgi:hypothetical protein